MNIREARLPADEPAILSFIAGLQDYQSAFEPDRRRDPDFVVDHWRELQHRCAENHGVFLIAEEAGKPWAGPSPMTRQAIFSWSSRNAAMAAWRSFMSCRTCGGRDMGAP